MAGAARQVGEFQLPDGQHAQAVVAERADIDLASVDILLGDGSRADALVDEADALDQPLVAVDHRGLRDAFGGVLAQALDDEREGEALRPPDLAVHGEDGEGRHRNAVIGEKLLGDVLAARQHQAARVAAGIGNAHQFEIAGDVLVVGGLAVELLEQIEDDVRLPALDHVADRLQLGLHAERPGVVAGGAQRREHVVFRLPDVDLLLAVALHGVGRHQIRMHQHQNAQRLHRANHFRRPVP